MFASTFSFSLDYLPNLLICLSLVLTAISFLSDLEHSKAFTSGFSMFLFLHFETCYLINLIPYVTVSKKADSNLAIAQTPIKPVKYQPTTCFS